MTMKNPPHPGLTIRHDILDPLHLSVTAGAEKMGVGRALLQRIVTGRARITKKTAVKLAKTFGSSAATWYGMQVDYDMAQAKRSD